MVDTKPAATWKANWDASRARVPAAYAEGINANTNFFEAAKAGQGTYETMMSNPSVLQRRLTGLERKSSQADWKSKASTLGAQRISAGMAAGKPKYDSSVDVSRAALEAVTLPDRTADFRANIQNRVVPIVEALKSVWGRL